MNTTTHHLSKINGIPVMIPNELKDFTLAQKDSSQVIYFGVNQATNSIYVQFKSNNMGYLYPNQPIDAIKAIMTAESVGSWVIKNLSRPKDKPAAEFVKTEYVIEPATEEVKA